MTTTSASITIITPTYNRAEYIGEAIASVLAQSYQDWELIIWDDGSTDNTPEVVASFSDPRIHYYQGNHQGAGAAYASAIVLSNTPYIGILDSDDYLHPNCLKEVLEVYNQNPDATMVYTAHLNLKGERLELEQNPLIYTHPDAILDNFRALHFRSFARWAYKKVGGIDPAHKCCEDWALVLKLSELEWVNPSYKIHYINKPLYVYRIHEQQSTKDRLSMHYWQQEIINECLERRGYPYRRRINIKAIEQQWLEYPSLSPVETQNLESLIASIPSPLKPTET